MGNVSIVHTPSVFSFLSQIRKVIRGKNQDKVKEKIFTPQSSLESGVFEVSLLQGAWDLLSPNLIRTLLLIASVYCHIQTDWQQVQKDIYQEPDLQLVQVIGAMLIYAANKLSQYIKKFLFLKDQYEHTLFPPSFFLYQFHTLVSEPHKRENLHRSVLASLY